MLTELVTVFHVLVTELATVLLYRVDDYADMLMPVLHVDDCLTTVLWLGVDDGCVVC